jgi:hypothetical protein
MPRLIAEGHETATRRRQLRRRAFQLLRSLLERGIIESAPREASGRRLRVNIELQEDFSLHQALSLFLIDTCPLLDRESPDYPFDLLTLCEAIVEDPEPILRRQVDRLKGAKLEEMRAAGVPYEERMEKLEEVEHPKPLREFLYEHFNAFKAAHPWVEQENVRPKSIAREMFERYQSFADYIREYGLERSEGLLLRHLAQTWKVLAQTVPDAVKTEPVIEMEEYFRELIRGIDSSLLEEWERLRNPGWVAAETTDKPARPQSYDLLRDRSAFGRLLRGAVLGFLQDVAARDWEAAAARVDLEPPTEGERPEGSLTGLARRIEDAFRPYFEARGRFRLDPEGRAAKHLHVDETPEIWDLAQVLVDPDEQNDWEVRLRLSPSACRAQARVVLEFDGVSPVGGAPDETVAASEG